MSRHKWIMQVAIALAMVSIVGMSAHAQRGGRGGAGGAPAEGGGGPGGGGRGGFGGFGGGGFGGFGRTSNPASFALRDDVKKELDLSTSQVSDLEKVAEGGPDMRELMQSFGNFRDMSDEERQEAMTEMREKMEAGNEKLREETLAVLSSRQKGRFAELQFQYALSNGDAVAALKSAEVELDADAEAKLQEAMREVNAKLQERVAAIRLELQMEAMSSIVSESKIEGLMGEKFAFESTRGGPGGAFGRQRGGQGGPGAARPGGGRAGGGTNARRARPSTGDDPAEEDSGAANPRRGRDR